MSRLKKLRKYINGELDKMDDADKCISAAAHLYGVSLAATMIAKKRGLDPELASMAGMLHDLYAYKTGSYDDHAHKGAELARKILKKLDLTDKAETDLICSAIYHHNDKQAIDSPMDEVLKDADVIHHCMNDLSKEIKEKEQARFQKLCDEYRKYLRSNTIVGSPAYLAKEIHMVGKYKVITLCGSTRFKDAFIEEQKRLTLEGNIVISVGLFGHSGDDEVWNEGTKEMLDDMHKRKIDMADEIFVINVGGYIGSSTRSEIEYAIATGKAVRYLEPVV